MIQAHWHENRPIYSVDFHPTQSARLATSGGDEEIKIWLLGTIFSLIEDNPSTQSGQTQNATIFPNCVLTYLASLKGHQAAVNCVRWTPNGKFLASCSDDGVILVWCQDEEAEPPPDSEYVEVWHQVSMIRTNVDSYDLSWSPDSRYLLCCGTDGAAAYDLVERSKAELGGHTAYVQGVAWDPRGEYVATQSADRSLRVSRVSFLA